MPKGYHTNGDLVGIAGVRRKEFKSKLQVVNPVIISNCAKPAQEVITLALNALKAAKLPAMSTYAIRELRHKCREIRKLPSDREAHAPNDRKSTRERYNTTVTMISDSLARGIEPMQKVVCAACHISAETYRRAYRSAKRSTNRPVVPVAATSIPAVVQVPVSTDADVKAALELLREAADKAGMTYVNLNKNGVGWHYSYKRTIVDSGEGTI
jgi:tryptophanyl-tRNA synthetase